MVISDIRFYATVVKSGGAAIRFRKALRCHVETCMVLSPQDFQTFGAKLWDGVVFEACADCKIDGCSMWGFGQDAVRLYGDDIYNGEINITGGSWITYASRYGVACLGRFGGLRLDSGDISACWRNLCIDQLATPGFPNREIFISGQFLSTPQETPTSGSGRTGSPRLSATACGPPLPGGQRLAPAAAMAKASTSIPITQT